MWKIPLILLLAALLGESGGQITDILPLALGLEVRKGNACILCFAEARQSYRNDSD